jgi:RNA polymerase sigma factor for flagellar operon FliA
MATGAALYRECTAPDEQLVLDNMGMVNRIAHHLQARAPRFVEAADLVQAGMLGLISAARQYEPAKCGNFEGFAYLRIKGAMIDEIRRQSYLPRSAVAINKAHSDSAEALASRLGRRPSAAELAAYMEMDVESLQRERAKAIQFETDSMEDHREAIESMAADDSAVPERQVERAQLMAGLQDAIEHLPAREKTVLALYYVEEMNLREIGEIIGVSESRVSQILSKTAIALRSLLDGNPA